jgi:membrane-associated protease RseP (regulator of RpoE activity)
MGVSGVGPGGMWAGLGVVVLLSAAATSEAQQVRAGAVRRGVPDTTQRDSVMRIQITAGPGELMKMISDLMVSRATEERIAMTLREAGAERMDEARVRELGMQLSGLARRNAGLASAIRLQCARNDMQPEGYMGLNFEGIEQRRYGDGPVLYHFGNNTAIVSVDPGSPAERAGLLVSDEVVAINGNDARKPIALGTLLKPGMRVSVKVSREGKMHDMTVNVGKRPDDVTTPCHEVDDLIGTHRTAPQTIYMKRATELPQKSVSREVVVSGQGSEPGMFGRGGQTFTFVSPFPTPGASLIAGASFLTLDADWRETLGVDRGLLVTMVSRGSPAQEAGLKKGDVIVNAGETVIARPVELWRIVNEAGSKGITLKIIRAGKPGIVMLRTRVEKEP